MGHLPNNRLLTADKISGNIYEKNRKMENKIEFLISLKKFN